MRTVTDPAQYVDPMIGTDAAVADFGTGGSAGNTFPGAVAPFGMIQWSPETLPGLVNFAGGYSYVDTKIRGFSLTHLSGVGCAHFQDVPFLPTVVPVTTSPSTYRSYDIAPEYLAASGFTHEQERAEPGYYQVKLDPAGASPINVELTATERAGLARLTFPPTTTASVLINAGGSAMANSDAAFTISPTTGEVAGTVASGQFCFQRNTYVLHFVARFDRPFAAHGTWVRQELRPGATMASDHAANPLQVRPVSHGSTGAQAGTWVTFDTTSDAVVRVRVGLSWTSIEEARANLDAEIPDFDFDRVKSAARSRWNLELGRIEVSGGNPDRIRTFYSMLYRALVAPTIFSDADGSYLGMDGLVHQATGAAQYTNFSGWDVYRTAIPLLAMLDPARTSDMGSSLLANARESGWLPKWPVANAQTNVMVGDPASPILAGMWSFGARAFDGEEALGAMVHGARDTGQSSNDDYVERAGLSQYLTLGYVPYDGTAGSSGSSTSIFGRTDAVWGSASTTLEYATADFSIARLAANLGDTATSAEFLLRSDGWQQLFRGARRRIEPRYASGKFPSLGSGAAEGFVEGNAPQYAWMVPFNRDGLLRRMGGRRAVGRRLARHLSLLNEGPRSPHAFLGNEPGLSTPWTWLWLGRPGDAQEAVARARDSLYADVPTGYPGNDDLGTLSAWYVFASLGLYPAIPGDDVLAITTPAFPDIVVHLAEGDLHIQKTGLDPYVASWTIDGIAQERAWLRWPEVACGARLEMITQNPAPTAYGTSEPQLPPSYPAGEPLAASTTAVCPEH